MRTRQSRRKFLGLIGVGASVSALAVAGAAAADAPRDAKADKTTYSGTSKKGNWQEALDLAVQAALKDAPGADRLATWTFKEASGRQGGIAGFMELTVTIEASAG